MRCRPSPRPRTAGLGEAERPRSLALASQRRLPTNLRSAGHQCRNSRGRARRRGRCDGRRTHECDDAGCQIVLYLTLPELI
uniref:Uncharacterized protein n=1 Tax=Setaria italica TaxID=4555 RepID=K3XNW0_SETIT